MSQPTKFISEDNLTYLSPAFVPEKGQGVPTFGEVVTRKNLKGKLAAAALVAAGVIWVGMHSGSSAPAAPSAPKEHSTSYLNDDPKSKPITVEWGDSPTSIVQNANHHRLSGQALLDEAAYVQNEGKGMEADGKTPELKPGQSVVVPIMPEPQIEQVNNGGLGNG